MDLNFPSELRLLKDDSIDFSEFVREIKKTADSHYYNSSDLWRIENLLTTQYVEKLCDRSKYPKECINKTRDSDLDSTIREIQNNEKNRILYPIGYLPVGSLKEDLFLKAFQSLDTPCLEKCSDEDLVQAVKSSSPKQYKTLFPKIKEQGKECLRDLLEKLREDLEYGVFLKACLKAENKTHVVCKSMLERLKTTKKRVSDLMAIAYDPAVLTEAGAFCTDCLNQEKETELLQLTNSLTNLNRLNPCLELGPGEEKMIKIDSPINVDYMLKRDNEGNYHIDFPVEFYADEDYDGAKAREAVPSVYREKVQECLKEANTMMLGPKGEKINLSISKIPECSTQRQSRPNRIAIGSKDHRSNSKKYESDIDCSTITHEILHLAGLCDEYTEKTRGWYVNPETGEIISSSKEGAPTDTKYEFKAKYDCRVVATNSIMSDDKDRWNYAKDNNKSLLSPGHFNSLLYGSCMSKNQKYMECSAIAYQSSVLDGDSCLDKKTQCEKNNALGLDKQGEIDELEEILDWASFFLNRTRLPSWLNFYKDLKSKTEQRLEVVRSWPDQ